MPDLACIYARALQEYLETLATADDLLTRRKRNLLLAYAELQFKLHGGSRCAMCSTPVRHVIPVFVERFNGVQLRHTCLCTRCLEAEKAVSKRVVLKIGEASVEYVGFGRDYKIEAHPSMMPMKMKPKMKQVKRAAAG
jgi:hypothetical protein